MRAKVTARAIQAGERSEGLDPLIHVEEAPAADLSEEQRVEVQDTVLAEPFEDEKELFKEVRLLKRIEGTPYRIITRKAVLEPHEQLASIGLALGGVISLLFVGSILLQRFVSKKTWKPFYQNLNELRNYSIEDGKDIRLTPSDIDEFRALNEAVRTLVDRARSEHRALKQFTENAAHEIQTPLAVIRKDLEEMLQAPDLSEEAAHRIRSSLSSVERLSRMTKTLLFLTRLEHEKDLRKEELELRGILEELLEQYQDRLSQKGLFLQKDLDEVTLEADRSLIEVLFSNVLSNAIKHNIEKGWIVIELDQKQLRVRNSGTPLERDPEAMFGRFSKGDPSSRSSGLGLSIVRKICERYGWKADYKVGNGEHEVTVRFDP